MRSNAVFWAIILIVVGFVLLLGNLGLVNVSWAVVWPLLIIACGAWLIVGTLAAPRRKLDTEDVSIPLGGAARADIRIDHGAGILRLSSGAASDVLAAGSFAGGMDYRTSHNGDTLNVRMHIPRHGWPFGPWGWGGGFDWDMRLNGQVPLQLRVDGGASKTELDLADLLVTDLRLDTGASATQVTLPAHAGRTTVKVEAGAASVEIDVPGGVAARIRTSGGLAAIDVDTTRFPGSGGLFQSPDFDTAANRIEMKIETGIGAVKVR